MLFSLDVQSHPGVQSHPDLRYHEKYLKVLEIWCFREFKSAEVLGPNHFYMEMLLENGTCDKMSILVSDFVNSIKN